MFQIFLGSAAAEKLKTILENLWYIYIRLRGEHSQSLRWKGCNFFPEDIYANYAIAVTLLYKLENYLTEVYHAKEILKVNLWAELGLATILFTQQE